MTATHIEGFWPGYSQERPRGVKFISGTNEVAAMSPPGGTEGQA